MKKPFKIAIQYFKESGKLYVSEEVTREFTACEPVGCCYMNDVVDWIRECRASRSLPGLQSGFWSGYIYVDCPDGYPCLILPPGVQS